MKKIWILILVAVATPSVCRAQLQPMYVTNPAYVSMDSLSALEVTNDASGNATNLDMDIEANAQTSAPVPSYAEIVTPDIQALADGMQDNPLDLFNFVHDHIRYVPYFGSMKGAELTYLERSGNDFDQCALLVALLRAANYTNCGYQFGWMMFPFDNPDGSGQDLHHWWNLGWSNGDWTTTFCYLDSILSFGFYPTNYSTWTAPTNNNNHNTFVIQHVWVTLTNAGTVYYLDPSFKVSVQTAGINLTNAMGFSSNSLMSATGGTEIGGPSSAFCVTNLNESGLRSALSGCTSNLLQYLQNNCPNASLAQVLGGATIVPSTNTSLPQSLLFPTTNFGGQMPVTNWGNEPTNMMSKMTISFGGTNFHLFAPQLQGECLSMVVGSTGAITLRLDTNKVATGSSGGGTGTFNVTLQFYQPGQGSSWNSTNNSFVQGKVTQSVTKGYQKANAYYAIMYGFDPDWGWLQEREQVLETYRAQGLSDTSWQVTTASLNVMALNYQVQLEYMGRMLAQEMGMCPINLCHMGRMAEESGFGYYVDEYMAEINPFSTYPNYSATPRNQFCGQYSCFASAMEHGLIEQLQSSNLLGVSTVKILELACTNNKAIYLVNSSNWSSVEPHLTGYVSLAKGTIENCANQGFTILVPQNGTTTFSSSNPWSGFGMLAFASGAYNMFIGDNSGVHNGGYSSDLGAAVSPGFIDVYDYSQPQFLAAAPATVQALTGADPVDMVDGTFQVEATDLSLGGVEPRGLNFSRYYNGTRRSVNPAGIAPGWIHNYYLNATQLSAPQALLGGATPAQAAPLLVATVAAGNIFNFNNPDPDNWMVTVLTSKWAIDQITAKAVSVSLGKDTYQFTQQPTGAFTPPANCTMTLTQSGGAYTLQERHGRAFQFNAAGWATNILDQYGASLQLTYNSSNWVTKATDWKGRTLTFTYTGSNPNRLTSVTDNASRSIGLGYSSGGDLKSVTDPEGKTSTSLYDTNHQIIAVSNATGQVVVSNIYNTVGRVTTQYTAGNTNNVWRIFWNGWQTIEQDPLGDQRTFFYDDQSRQIGLQDALGNLRQEVYDGQNHVVFTISPLNETNQLFYDANNNLIYKVDPLGSTSTFLYDANNNLTETIDPLGHSNTFGYNAQFSLTSSANGAGNSVTFTYNTDGTVATRQDPGGTTTYGYDSTYRQLNSILYPGSLDSETFQYSVLGDVTTHINPNGFTNVYQYNQRRQLTNVIGPANLTASLGYDAVGNRQFSKDARSNTITYSWSATRHQTGAVYPTTPQGVPTTTNFYDSRDWLYQTRNPLQKPTYYSNNAAQQLIAVANALFLTNTFIYDPDGHLTNSTDAASHTTSQTYDPRGETLTVTDAATHTVGKAYDAAGNLIYLTNRNGHVWQFQYDAANRLTNTISPTGKITGKVFNNRGLLQSVTDALTQTTGFSYDAKGRMTNRADNIGNTGYIFDADNNLTAVTNVGQVSGVAWAYDAYDRPVSSTDVNGNQIQYRYDPNGNLTNLVYPGNLTVNYYYDNLNRLTNVTDWAGRHTTNTFDLGSELTTVSRPNGTVRAVAYDAAGQTTNIVEHYATGAMAIEYIAQHWNNAAQMDWTFVAPVPHAYSPPSRTMTYDNDNRLESINGTSVTMDNDGNMTYGPGTNGAFVTSTFDVRNRLTSAGGISYGYDPANNRTALTNGSTVEAFVIDPATSQVLMRIKPGVTNYYIYGNGLLYEVDVTATTNTTLYYHYDSRGCTVALTDANGNITDRMEYSAYGMLTYRLGTNDTPFLYNGRYGVQTDLNGLLYMRNRYYNPYICRFLNADPSGFAGGLNMYAFADGNPISEMDPFGLGAVGDDNLRGGTWLAQVAEGLGFDVSLGGDQVTPPTITVEQVARGILGLATGGLYEPALGLVAGQDIDGNPVDRGGAAEQLMQVATVDANIFLALATEGFSAEAEGATGGFVGAGSAETIVTPQGPAIQAVSTEAQTALADVQGGATVYRQGWTGFQRTSDAQFWAFQNPATTPNYAGQLGMPAASTQGEYFWMMGGRVPSGTSVITRPAPGIGANAGGSMEAVVNPGGVRVDWFHMP